MGKAQTKTDGGMCWMKSLHCIYTSTDVFFKGGIFRWPKLPLKWAELNLNNTEGDGKCSIAGFTPIFSFQSTLLENQLRYGIYNSILIAVLQFSPVSSSTKLCCLTFNYSHVQTWVYFFKSCLKLVSALHLTGGRASF